MQRSTISPLILITSLRIKWVIETRVYLRTCEWPSFNTLKKRYFCSFSKFGNRRNISVTAKIAFIFSPHSALDWSKSNMSDMFYLQTLEDTHMIFDKAMTAFLSNIQVFASNGRRIWFRWQQASQTFIIWGKNCVIQLS